MTPDSGLLLGMEYIPDSKVHGANMGPTWVLSAPDGPHVGPMNLAISDALLKHVQEDSICSLSACDVFVDD